jgi:hypothetical protein
MMFCACWAGNYYRGEIMGGRMIYHGGSVQPRF